jgi:membrane protein DedA with SNARE-associated domain
MILRSIHTSSCRRRQGFFRMPLQSSMPSVRGLVVVAVIIFIESGVLFPFLPGDSLLVTAAVLAGPLGIQPWQILAVGIPAAFLGDQIGYWLGRRFGRKALSRRRAY